MLGFLNRPEKDALTLEKERLDKYLASLQRQSQELEKRLHRRFPQETVGQKRLESKPERIARFIPDEESLEPSIQKGRTASKTDLLKHQKRLTRNRVISMAVVALILVILVIRTLF